MKTDDELFQETYQTCSAEDVTDFDEVGFIADCEKFYGMKTVEFLKWFRENDFEGNPVQQLWFMMAKKE